MMAKNKYIKFSEQIRQAVKDYKNNTGLCNKVICKRIKIGQASFSRFMTTKAGLKLSTLDHLAKEIGFEIKITDKSKGR